MAKFEKKNILDLSAPCEWAHRKLQKYVNWTFQVEVMASYMKPPWIFKFD